MNPAITIALTPTEYANIAGWAGYYVAHPNETPTRLVLEDRSQERLLSIAKQLGLHIPAWKLRDRDPADADPVYHGPINPDDLTADDWALCTTFPPLFNRPDIFARSPYGHPNGQDAGNSARNINVDAYVAAGGTFSPWLVKE